MASKRVAVVTGSNTGLGLATVRGLCKQFDGDVFITSRSMDRGKAGQAELEKEGLHPKLHQLDIDDEQSVIALRDDMKHHYGGIDVLINNAGMAFPGSSTVSFKDQVPRTNQTNFWNTLRACDILFPILKPHARVVNVGSYTTKIVMKHMSDEVRSKVLSCKTMDDVKNFMKAFEQAVAEGCHKEKGWPEWGYAISKVGTTAMSFIQQQKMDQDPREDIIINVVDPGLVATNMTAGIPEQERKTPDEGAMGSIYLALLPPGSKEPKGIYFSEMKVEEWN